MLQTPETSWLYSVPSLLHVKRFLFPKKTRLTWSKSREKYCLLLSKGESFLIRTRTVNKRII